MEIDDNYGLYVDLSTIETLGDKELIKRYWRIENMLSKLDHGLIPSQMAGQIVRIEQIYDNELQRRIEEGILEEEDVEDFYNEYDERMTTLGFNK
jgi:hypothetical protein